MIVQESKKLDIYNKGEKFSDKDICDRIKNCLKNKNCLEVKEVIDYVINNQYFIAKVKKPINFYGNEVEDYLSIEVVRL